MADEKMIDEKFEQVLLGSLLGDGCLTFSQRSINPLYTECHSVKQLEYLKWKNRFFNCEIKTRSTFPKKTNKKYLCYYFRTHADSSLLPYYKMFYTDGIKTISQQILDALKPEAIAIWYCDDGSYSYYNNNIKISLMPMQNVHRKLIFSYFKSKFCINFKFQDEYMYLNADDSKKFTKIIEKYVPSCMDYKLGKDLMKKAAHREKNYNKMKLYWLEKSKDLEYMKMVRIRNNLAMKKLRADQTYREIYRKRDREYKRKLYRNDPQYREKILSRGREYWKKMREVLAKSKNYQIT